MLKIFSWLIYIFVSIHIILHLDKTLDIQARPSGKYTLIANSDISKVEHITLVRCPNLHQSNHYEIMAGLRLAKQYPNIKINAVGDESKISVHKVGVDREVDLQDPTSKKNLIVRGNTIADNGKNICSFTIDL
ncbi:MAG: hypothetical protein QNJ50_07150 [Mastigocoleus sp. MO_188.B34]|nr:hypothetical protein [Mastigocoleus sp. MO_188.B34]